MHVDWTRQSLLAHGFCRQAMAPGEPLHEPMSCMQHALLIMQVPACLKAAQDGSGRRGQPGAPRDQGGEDSHARDALPGDAG